MHEFLKGMQQCTNCCLLGRFSQHDDFGIVRAVPHQVHVTIDQAREKRQCSHIKRLVLGWNFTPGNQCDDLLSFSKYGYIAAVVSCRSIEDP